MITQVAPVAGWGDAGYEYPFGTWGASSTSAGSKTYREVAGKGGYVYRQFNNGDIQILQSPVSTSVTYLPASAQSSAWKAITAEIGAWSAKYSTGGQVAATAGQIAAATGTAAGADFAAIVDAFQTKGQAAGLAAAAVAAAKHGPAAYSFAQDWIAARGDNPATIRAKIAKLTVKYQQAKAKGQVAIATKAAYQIQALKTRLAQLESGATAPAVADLPATSSAGTPWGLLAGIGAGVALLLVVVTVAGRRRSEAA